MQHVRDRKNVSVQECLHFPYGLTVKSSFVISTQLFHPKEQLPVPAGSRDLLGFNSFIFSMP